MLQKHVRNWRSCNKVFHTGSIVEGRIVRLRLQRVILWAQVNIGSGEMRAERYIELLVELHAGLPRLGPGCRESTLKALALCEELPDCPEILDVGCGTGAQTLLLASATQGRVLGVDLYEQFITQLRTEAESKGLADRVRGEKADMNALPYGSNSFDLIWSEGAIYIMGFDNGLAKWRRLLKPGGYLVVTEAVWLRSDPPAELRAFWQENYPGMRSVEANLEAAKALGWQPVGNFHLPLTAWLRDYYGPLAKRIPSFRNAHADDEDAQQLADQTEHEMDLTRRYHAYYGYEFFIFRS